MRENPNNASGYCAMFRNAREVPPSPRTQALQPVAPTSAAPVAPASTPTYDPRGSCGCMI